MVILLLIYIFGPWIGLGLYLIKNPKLKVLVTLFMFMYLMSFVGALAMLLTNRLSS